MFDAARLLAFAAVTATTSAVPGPSMIFVLTQSAWRGPRSAALALIGLQIGYMVWWVLAGLGLGGLMGAAPLAYRSLAVAGAGYLAWLGLNAWRYAGEGRKPDEKRAASARPLRDGIVIAVGNPKALIYMVAVIPPFIEASRELAPQLTALAVIAGVIDVAIAALYIAAGDRIAALMTRAEWRVRLDRIIGTVFIALAMGAVLAVTR